VGGELWVEGRGDATAAIKHKFLTLAKGNGNACINKWKWMWQVEMEVEMGAEDSGDW